MKKNVLVFPCGSEIGLEINRSLRYTKDFELFGASSMDDHGKYVYKNYISDVPFVDDVGFIDSINSIVDRFCIDFIFPAHDSVVLKLARNAQSVHAKILSSSVETCEIARSKSKTYGALEGVVKVPRMYGIDDELSFPVFLKPDVGQGSKGTVKVDSRQELTAALKHDATLLILEYLPGPEYTIDCLTGNDGRLLYAQARQRNRISGGISVNSFPVDDKEFRPIAEQINQAVRFEGVWFFQVKRDYGGMLTLLEIAPRVAGTMALSRIGGTNLPLLSLYLAEGIEVQVLHNHFDVEIDRALENKYSLGIDFDTVYVDFDDSVIVEGQVNYLLIAYLYKMRNEDKRIVLITKHAHVLGKTLAKYGISEKLFDKIVHVRRDDKKSKYIEGKSIFIDDSFSERSEVSRRLSIPVFDISEVVELL